MPLDHVNGERFEDMDAAYAVVPFEKYAEQTRLTVPVIVRQRFKRDRCIEKPRVKAAMEQAASYYQSLGLTGCIDDLLVQEYHLTGQVAFLFCMYSDGKEELFRTVFTLSQEQISDLAHRGLWKPAVLH